ncbi:MAG: TetR/AcrR family transcriptional regulator [Actinomycetota bacterium]|nr:TetR/AcrR family transcriptional regulator [Actinomycetota bacterium]
MPRSPSPQVRALLIDRAAELLARREPVTLRALVAGTGVSTMAVYTYFDGMPGLWGAVRQEGFRRLAERLQSVATERDPVRHLALLGVGYVDHALSHPNLYRVMFDASFDLPDPATAGVTFERVVAAAGRCVDAGRFRAEEQPGDIALRFWANGHGIVSLAVTGVVSVTDLRRHAPAMTIAQFIDAGDSPDRARRSVRSAWRASE